MSTKSLIYIESSTENSNLAIKAILAELTTEELSRLAIDVIEENRTRLNHAQTLFEHLEAVEHLAEADDRNLSHAYRKAILQVRVHHELVRIVIDELGYVPDALETTKSH